MDYRVPCRIGWVTCIKCVAGPMVEEFSVGDRPYHDAPCGHGAGSFVGGVTLGEAQAQAGRHRSGYWARVKTRRARGR